VELLMTEHVTVARVLQNPTAASLKRIAWAYGCSKKGSDEERLLLAILLDRTAREVAATLADRQRAELLGDDA
jgi:hypothetical protein